MAADADKLGFNSWVVLIALAVIPAAFAGGFTQFEFLKDTLLFGLSGLALAGWGVGVLRGRTIRMTGGRIATLLISLALFALLAVAWSPSSNLGFAASAQWLSAMTLFVVVIAPVGRPLRLAEVVPAIAAGTLAAAAVGLLDFAGIGLTTEVWDPPGAAGAFDAREFAVPYYAVVLPLLAFGLFDSTGGRRVLAGLALVAGAVHFGMCADLLTGGLTAAVYVLTAGIAALFQGGAKFSAAVLRPFGALVVSMGFVLGFAAFGPAVPPANEATELPWISGDHPSTKVDQSKPRDPRFAIPRIEEIPSSGARSYTFGIALDLFREEPIIGQGPGGWWAAQTKFPRPDESFVVDLLNRYPAFRAPHNGYALTLAELGGVGLFLLLAWLSAIAGMVATGFASKSDESQWLTEFYALAAAFGAGVVAAAVTPALQLAAPTAALFVVAGLLVRRAAALNEFKGMSSVWTINGDGKKKWDTSLFCGVVPIALSLMLMTVSTGWGVYTYYRSWGDLAMLRTQDELAVDKYGLANDILSGDADTLYNLALAKKRLGQLDEARDFVNEAATLRPYDVRIINLIAALHLRDQKYADAVKASRRAITLFPNYWDGRRALATALNLQGRMADSANELLELLKLNASDKQKGQVHREVAEMYQGPLDNPAKAAEHYELALKLTKERFMRERITQGLEEMKKEVERRRLMREGKPLPPELIPAPKAPPGHGPGDGHNH